jgi:hypothetical protein
MKFKNNNGLEIILNPGQAIAKGHNGEGEEISVKLDSEMAESINYLYNLDIFDLEKLHLMKQRNFNYKNFTY